MQASIYTVWPQFARLVKQVLPSVHGQRGKTLAWVVMGIMLVKSVSSAQSAEVLRRVQGTQASSQERTVSRFLANEAIDAQALWPRFFPARLANWARQPELTFVVETTFVGNWAILVSFGLLHHWRGWPPGWRVMPREQQWQEGQSALIAPFIQAVGPSAGQAQCRLLAGSGLTREQLVQVCEQAGWHSLLRRELDKGYSVKELDAAGRPNWQPLTQILTQPGQYWQGRVWLWKAHLRQTWLTASWQVGQEAPLVVISDEGAGRHSLCRYRKRMRVEATFQDKKSRAFGLHLTHVRQREHLERLLLRLSLAIWWLARLGAACMHHGKRRLFDRGARPDKSVLRLGRQWFLDILQRGPSAASLARCLPFQRQGTHWRLCLRS